MRNLHDIHRLTSVFDDLWRLRETRWPGQALHAPSTRSAVRDDGTQLEITLDLPGVDVDGLDIQLDQGVLTIEGYRGDARRSTEEGESLPPSYRRLFRVPSTIDTDGVRADLEHGVLTLVLPRQDKALPQRIEVTTRALPPAEAA